MVPGPPRRIKEGGDEGSLSVGGLVEAEQALGLLVPEVEGEALEAGPDRERMKKLKLGNRP